MSKLNVLIAGCSGYIGLQLTKILNKHKNVNIKYLCGSSSIGKQISFFDKSIKNKKLPKIRRFNKKFLNDVDLIFTALPNGESQKISNYLLNHNTLIDLSADFRLKKATDYVKWYKFKHQAVGNIQNSIYSVPELKKNNLKNYKIISCPGCYPTSILIPLVPLINKGFVATRNIIIDSKSGFSGAGRGVHKKYKDKNLYESLSAYGVAQHRHNSEIQQEFNLLTKKTVKFQFTPHLTPMFRGILSTIYLDLKNQSSIKKISQYLKKFYKNSGFIKIEKPDTFLSTNDVINTNYCRISICKSKFKDKIIILCAIDNLIKGGGGQAVQNMNIKFGFKESEGLNV